MTDEQNSDVSGYTSESTSSSVLDATDTHSCQSLMERNELVSRDRPSGEPERVASWQFEPTHFGGFEMTQSGNTGTTFVTPIVEFIPDRRAAEHFIGSEMYGGDGHLDRGMIHRWRK